MNFTITIAREYGSGGRFIASKVAEILNIPFYDKNLLLKEAQDKGINPNDIMNLDEEEKEFYLPTMNNTYGMDLEMSQRSYMATLKMIQLIASSQSSVIVGRCADYILSDDEDAVLKVFIYAPMESKVKRAIKYYGLSKNKEETRKIIEKKDKKRKKYYEFITEKNWGDPVEYDLLVNSDMGIEEAAYAIAAAAKAKFNIK